MPTLEATLLDLDEIIRKVSRAFHKTLGAGASEATLARLAAATGPLPADIATWFTWHDGSRDGFLPDTSWGLIDVDEAISEVAFLRTKAGPPALQQITFCVPLATARDGGLLYYCRSAGAGPVIAHYDRGELVDTTPFESWLASVVEVWRAEGAIVRPKILRTTRTFTGIREIQLSKSARKRLLELLTSGGFAKIVDILVVTIRVGEQAGLELDEDGLSIRAIRVTATKEELGALTAQLANANQRSIPVTAAVQITFVDR